MRWGDIIPRYGTYYSIKFGNKKVLCKYTSISFADTYFQILIGDAFIIINNTYLDKHSKPQ